MTWPTSNPVARELNDFWQESQSLMQEWWVQADIDTKMTTGQQDYYNGFYNNGTNRNQKLLQFNKLLRLINMVGGYQRDNRLATIVSAADNDPDNGHTSDQKTAVMNWVMRQDNTYSKISEAFDGANITGLNLLSVWMDFREDPENGTIKVDRIPYNAFLMDPWWTKHSLEDCDRIWTRKYLTRRQLLSLYPKIEKDIPLFGKGYAAKDGKFQFLAQNWQNYSMEMYAYDEYWVRDYRKTRKIVDKTTGEMAEWKGNKEQFQLLRRYNPNVELVTAHVPTIRYYVLVNNHVIYEEKSPYGLDRMPFVPMVCYHFPEVQNYAYRYQGIIRNCRDSQVELNRRRNRLLDILDAQVQSGLMVKEDALVNPEDAFFQGPGKVLYFKQSSNLQTDVAPIPAPPVAQGWPELIQSLDQEIMSIVGTPEELFGEARSAKDQSGVMMKLKMGAGLISLQNIFDNLNQTQTALGDIMNDMIEKNFTPGKIKKILGEQPSEYFFNSEDTKYHCIVEEGQLTSSQRQLEFLQALHLRSLDIPISNKYILEKSTLQGKKEIIEDMQQQEQAMQQMNMAQMQSQIQQQQVLTRSLEAKAQNDFAAADEKKARAVSDIALAKQHAAQAQHDLAKSALDNAKALKELNDMDEDRLVKLSNFVVEMEAKQKALSMSGGEEGDSVLLADIIGSSVEQANQETKVQKQTQ